MDLIIIILCYRREHPILSPSNPSENINPSGLNHATRHYLWFWNRGCGNSDERGKWSRLGESNHGSCPLYLYSQMNRSALIIIIFFGQMEMQICIDLFDYLNGKKLFHVCLWLCE